MIPLKERRSRGDTPHHLFILKHPVLHDILMVYAGNTWNDLITFTFYLSHADITSVLAAMTIHILHH